MFTLVSLSYLSFLFGFAFPPLWIITFLCVWRIVRIGRHRHLEVHRAAEDARMKTYLAWSK